MSDDGTSGRKPRTLWAAAVAVVVTVLALMSMATPATAGAAVTVRSGAAPTVAGHPQSMTRCPPCVIEILALPGPKSPPKIKHEPFWGVAISGVNNGAPTTTNTSEITIGDLPNGVYHYLIFGPSGWVAANESGSVTLDNDNATVTTGFTQSPTHSLTVSETGLPKGTLWCATVASALTFCSSASRQRIANLTPATYNFSLTGAAGYGLKYPAPTTVNLTDGSLSVHLVYRPVLYVLTLEQSGLASGTVWHLTLFWYDSATGKHRQVSRSTSGTSLVFDVTNGTYNYTIKPIAGYTLPTETPITVSGAPVTRDLVFTAVPSAVTFTETGLASGTVWNITINGQTYSTNRTEIQVNLTDGRYGYTIGIPTGYTGHGSPVSVKVDGSPVSVKVRFHKS